HAGAVLQPDDGRGPFGSGQAVALAQGQALAQGAGRLTGCLGESDAAGKLHLASGLRVPGRSDQQQAGSGQRREPLAKVFCGWHGQNLRSLLLQAAATPWLYTVAAEVTLSNRARR